MPVPGAHDVIGDRAHGDTPAQVIALGRAVMDGLSAGGVLPIVKHVPGHGRATKDSHLELPVVTASRAQLEAADFATFRALADAPAAMTAHVVFTAIDPEHPASTSEPLVREIIRGAFGFDGLLMSDDLSMRALSGTMAARARDGRGRQRRRPALQRRVRRDGGGGGRRAGFGRAGAATLARVVGRDPPRRALRHGRGAGRCWPASLRPGRRPLISVSSPC